jgi:hypothetical protein
MKSIAGIIEQGKVQSIHRIGFISYSCVLPPEVELIFSSHSSRQK